MYMCMCVLSNAINSNNSSFICLPLIINIKNEN